MKYLKLFENHSNYDDFVDGGTMEKPNVSHCVQENEVHYNPIVHDYSKDYLTFVALEDCDFSLNYDNVVSYSLDNGETWEVGYFQKGGVPTVTAGNKIMWKSANATNTTNSTNSGLLRVASPMFGTFSSSGRFKVEGNIMSLLFGDNFEGQTNIEDDYFREMFSGCTGLTSAENLILPATTLEGYCYSNMFNGCTSLVNAPELPATTLAGGCYYAMFQGCTSLTVAPELHATTLANNCYAYMFRGCTSLTTAPVLPATTLAQYCYEGMFYNCTSLNYIKAMFTTTPSETYADNWVSGVASSGTFVKNCDAAWNVTGVNGTPTDWTVEYQTIEGGTCSGGGVK